MDLAVIPPRPRTVRCRCCNRSIKVAKVGRLPTYCGSACKQRAFVATHPNWKPNRPKKASIDDRVAMKVWQMLLDAKVIAADTPPPGPET